MSVIACRQFGITADGRKVTAYQMRNANDMCVTILDFGATIQSIVLPDASGVPTDVVLGYDDVASYERGSCYYGAVVGRYANRIGGAKFVLDGKTYQLQENEPGNHVHGVFAKRLFDATTEGDVLTLRYVSPDMEEGYPGNLRLEVRYRLLDDNTLEIGYQATADQPTVLNLTNHCYFNLNGQDGSTVFDHKVRLNSSNFTEYTPSFAQTGRIISVTGTPLDFRTEQSIGARFEDDYHQFRICTGYDHNMVLDGEEGALKEIGTARSERTGIRLEAYTTEPAIQFYSGNFMHFDPAPCGKGGVRYPKNGAFCMEAQHYPDSVNHAHFPNTTLRPGEVYQQTTLYRLTARPLRQ